MKQNKIIYLDSAATTPIYPLVIKEMQKYYVKEYGNPSSAHNLGEKALQAITQARKKIAEELGAKASEIIFTSGSTESNNLAFFGLTRSELGKTRKKIIISTIEHSSIIEICNTLQRQGFIIEKVPVNNEGIIDMSQLEKEIDNNTLLVSIMHVNNETGVIQNIVQIGKICKRKGVIFHTDAAQSFGKLVIKVHDMGIDMLTASAHKIHGPKGIGFLYVKENVILKPLIYGGGQEKGLRGGTENVPAIVGFAKALEEIKKVDRNKIKQLRDYFIDKLENLGGKINGSREKIIFNNVNVSFSGFDGESLVIALSTRGVMCSTGSACESRRESDDHVLKALGLIEKARHGALRFTLHEKVSKKDIDYTVSILKSLLKR